MIEVTDEEAARAETSQMIFDAAVRIACAALAAPGGMEILFGNPRMLVDLAQTSSRLALGLAVETQKLWSAMTAPIVVRGDADAPEDP